MSAEQKIIDEQKRQAQLAGANAAMEIAQSIQVGKPPATHDIVKVLDSTETALDRQKLSPEVDEKGKTIIRDTENLLGATKELLQAKNADNQVQRILSEAAEAGRAAGEIRPDQVLSDADQRRFAEMRSRMLETARIGRELLQLVVSSGEFRDLLASIINMSNYMFLNIKEEAKKGATVKEAVQHTAQAAQDQLSNLDKIPEQERAEFYHKLKDVVRKVNSSPQWRQGVRNMFALLDRFEYSAQEVEEKTAQAAFEVKLDRHAQAAVSETKELVEKFLPESKTLDPLLDRLRQLVFAIRSDNQLKEYFITARDYLNEAIESPAKLEDPAFRDRGEKMIDDGRALITKEEYRTMATNVLDEWRDVISGFKADDQLNMFNTALQKLARDLTYTDASGATHIDTHALNQIRGMIVPILLEQLKYIPVKHLQGSNKDYDWMADDIIISGYDIIPEHVLVQSFTEGDVVIRGAAPSVIHGHLLLLIENIKVKMEGLKFWFKRKSFPRIEDSGNADIDVAGGITLKIRMNMATDVATNRTVFTQGLVFCRADDVNVKVRDSKHDWIYNTFPGLFANPIKANMEKSIAENVASVISRIKNELNNILSKATTENVVKAVQSSLGVGKTVPAS